LNRPALARATAIALGAGRVAIGAGLWLAPRRSATALGFGEIDGPALTLGRIAATRDLVLGIWQLRTIDDPRRLRAAALATATADVGDALAFTLALRSDEAALRLAGIRGLAVAAPAAIAGLAVLLTAESQSH
jgi:hypothetical protein